jgi:hypothetical protein
MGACLHHWACAYQEEAVYRRSPGPVLLKARWQFVSYAVVSKRTNLQMGDKKN